MVGEKFRSFKANTEKRCSPLQLRYDRLMQMVHEDLILLALQ